jgi:hypothetical protein
MKTLFIALSFIFLSFMQSSNEKVYVCDSKTSKVYHCKKDCKELQKCTDEIIYITIDNAEKMGKKPCKICYSCILFED